MSTKEEGQPFLTDMICKYVFGRLPIIVTMLTIFLSIIARPNCWGTLYLVNLTSLFTWQRGLGPLAVKTSVAEQQDLHFLSIGWNEAGSQSKMHQSAVLHFLLLKDLKDLTFA